MYCICKLVTILRIGINKRHTRELASLAFVIITIIIFIIYIFIYLFIYSFIFYELQWSLGIPIGISK